MEDFVTSHSVTPHGLIRSLWETLRLMHPRPRGSAFGIDSNGHYQKHNKKPYQKPYKKPYQGALQE